MWAAMFFCIDRVSSPSPCSAARPEPSPETWSVSLDHRRDAGNPAGPNPIGLTRHAGRTAASPEHKVTNDPVARDIGRSVTNPLNRAPASLLPSAERARCDGSPTAGSPTSVAREAGRHAAMGIDALASCSFFFLSLPEKEGGAPRAAQCPQNKGIAQLGLATATGSGFLCVSS